MVDVEVGAFGVGAGTASVERGSAEGDDDLKSNCESKDFPPVVTRLQKPLFASFSRNVLESKVSIDRPESGGGVG